MRMLCDACSRPTMPGITNIQMQAGQPVMGVGGFAMKLTRSPEFFVLCDPCADYCVQYVRHVVRVGGAPVLRQQQAESDERSTAAA